MSRSTISTFQLFQMFPDEETARLYLESRLWPKGVTCPTCAGQDRITPRKAGFRRCNKCQLDFTIRTGTIFERSHIPLHKWLYAMYLLVTARKGISSMQIAKEIGVQQKSAWFMLHRIRKAMQDEPGQLSGTIEMDETFVGGKIENMHKSQRPKGTGNSGKIVGAMAKTIVVGMVKRGGRVKAQVVQNRTCQVLGQLAHDNIASGSPHRRVERLQRYQLRACGSSMPRRT